jgi:hypothetical protein
MTKVTLVLALLGVLVVLIKVWPCIFWFSESQTFSKHSCRLQKRMRANRKVGTWWRRRHGYHQWQVLSSPVETHHTIYKTTNPGIDSHCEFKTKRQRHTALCHCLLCQPSRYQIICNNNHLQLLRLLQLLQLWLDDLLREAIPMHEAHDNQQREGQDWTIIDHRFQDRHIDQVLAAR